MGNSVVDFVAVKNARAVKAWLQTYVRALDQMSESQLIDEYYVYMKWIQPRSPRDAWAVSRGMALFARLSAAMHGGFKTEMEKCLRLLTQRFEDLKPEDWRDSGIE